MEGDADSQEALMIIASKMGKETCGELEENYTGPVEVLFIESAG